MRRLETYRSKINISHLAGKLYIDPTYGHEQPSVKINYAVFSSKWDIEEVKEDNILRIIHRQSGDSVSLAFDKITDRINFTKIIYASKPVKQVGKGMNLESFANMNLKPRQEPYLNKSLKKFLTNLKDLRTRVNL